MALTKLRRGVLVEMTPQEEAAFEASRRPTVPQAKLTAFTRLRAVRAEKLNADMTLGPRTIEVTDDLRAQLRELKEYSDANPGADLPVILASGRAVTITRAQLGTIQSALATRAQSINAVAATKADAIVAASTLAEVAAVDIDTGWPA